MESSFVNLIPHCWIFGSVSHIGILPGTGSVGTCEDGSQAGDVEEGTLLLLGIGVEGDGGKGGQHRQQWHGHGRSTEQRK